MHSSTRRQLSMMRRIAQALTYLRGEATAAAMDEVAAAIGHAERSIRLIYQTAPLPGSEKRPRRGPLPELHEAHGDAVDGEGDSK